MVRLIGHVLCVLLKSLNEFFSLVLSTNMTFLGSSQNSRYMASKCFNYRASTRCWSLPVVLLVLIGCMPGHQLGILGVSKQRLQAVNHEQIPHHQGKNSPLCVIFFILMRDLLCTLLAHLLFYPTRCSLIIQIDVIVKIPLVRACAIVKTTPQVLILGCWVPQYKIQWLEQA